MIQRAAFVVVLAGCPSRKMVDNDGSFNTLFPQTPLSEAPCIEDQDCVVTHLKDGQCCPDPIHSASNLYTRDQFDQLVAHQGQICTESQNSYTCPPPPAPGHIDTVNRGQCVNQRCILIQVPAEAPGTPKPLSPAAQASEVPKPELAPDAATPTAASPTP